jgi:hypothetical protein
MNEQFLAGLVIGHPLDTIKVLLQNKITKIHNNKKLFELLEYNFILMKIIHHYY